MPATRREARNGFSLGAPEGTHTANPLSSVSWAPKLGEEKSALRPATQFWATGCGSRRRNPMQSHAAGARTHGGIRRNQILKIQKTQEHRSQDR